ncbi:MAG: hypothetical protein HKP31_01275, partial [Nitrosopumilus sp.]|nr:hypothetical protein [Nitrosopumilus sp.]
VPEIIIPDVPSEFEIKFRYIGQPYNLHDITPIIDINPESAIPFVHIQTGTAEVNPSVVGRIPVTITVDKNIPNQKIFLSVSYDAMDFRDVKYKSSWSDFLTLNIGDSKEQNLSSMKIIEFDNILELKLLQSAEFPHENLAMSFLNVIEDSRCPSDVTCIWQGKASLSFSMSEDLKTEIILDTYEKNTATVFGKYKVELIDVKPYPISTATIKIEDYTAVLRISKIQSDTISPLKQLQSGIPSDEIQCRESFILIPKYDNSPACVKPETISKLIERGWTTQLLVQDIVMKTMSKKLGPECSQNTMDDIMNGDVDEKCAMFIEGLATKRQSEMMQQGYAFDQENKSWTKEGYPDMLMNIVDYYQQNMKSSKIPHELKTKPLDIASIEDRYIHLNPADICAIISLELMSPDELEQAKSGTNNVIFLEFEDNDIEGMPILDELIRATHHLEFPTNDYSKVEMGLREFVDYEFFIMDKAIEKYGDAQEDYFMKLDTDLDKRLADHKKQGFSNEFIAPQLVYNDNVYILGHTVFWISDEHEMQSMSVHLKENIDESKKFVTLNDEDMESIPKIRKAIEKIGTELESVVAFKGVLENPDWNDYQEWYANKSAEQFGTEDVYVRGFVYEGEHYELGFMIC